MLNFDKPLYVVVLIDPDGDNCDNWQISHSLQDAFDYIGGQGAQEDLPDIWRAFKLVPMKIDIKEKEVKQIVIKNKVVIKEIK